MTTHEYLTDAQVAEITHRSVGVIRRMLTAGDIKSAKVAGRRLVRRDWLDAYIEGLAEGGERRHRRTRHVKAVS